MFYTETTIVQLGSITVLGGWGTIYLFSYHCCLSSVCSGKIDVDKGVGVSEDAVKDLKENIKTVAAFAQW